ncbi:hypothetical protein J3Q64DRAFT_1875667 [Phycomyces blakesleeanus]|uniref:Nuclear pore complex protein Nup88 n=2 Tax=Phycomyces blakesleeanus TaxID=4837 RepID=A0A162Q881_PHYB8|nr:hypothetical protein PHYBLDRAFT_76884 [Phycomyces blakesleeanus NRRL 1555(-)]OAD80926.1 hypothetical protein PHYBLDRAFT_76884 [Phycomyces blakesleeanus NRRL 1555(-)]|eukprot:XP_018298966.1 hypothetical protein PHYBLDRAFT_76884 [Phycomyces blakesleeanus NRRL 1555(-)]
MGFALPDGWIERLGDHPIFDQTNSTKSNISSQREGVTFLNNQEKCIAMTKTNDLIVAVDSEIRILNLNLVKEAWLQEAHDNDNAPPTDKEWLWQVPYRILDTPDINFPINSITPNDNGRLLAVAGLESLAAIALPREGFCTVTKGLDYKRELHCRTMRIGRRYFDEASTSVLKVAWHPLSEFHSHLVVLSGDSMLRMFDVSKDIEEAEQSFDLSPLSRKKPSKFKGFSFSEYMGPSEEAVSFSLGGDSNKDGGWEAFTVYFALRNGHVYALCPVLPYASVVKREHMETLGCVADAKMKMLLSKGKTFDQLDDDHQALYYLQQLHYQWLDEMLKSTVVDRQNHPSLVDRSMINIQSNKCSLPFTVKRQGPFLTGGNFDGVLDINTAQISDIQFIKSKASDILVVACTDGSVRNFLLGTQVDPQWLMPVQNNPRYPWQAKLGEFLSSTDVLPKMALYESIKLNKNIQGHTRMNIVVDPIYPDTYYVYHNRGVHIVLMKQWIDLLAEMNATFSKGGNKKDVGDSLQKWATNKSGSSTRCLVDSSPYKRGESVPIIGLCIVTDIYLSHCLFALSATYSLLSVEVGNRRLVSIEKGSLVSKAVESQLRDAVEDRKGGEDGYTCILSLPPFEVPKSLQALQQLPNQSKVVIPASMGGNKKIIVNEETLRFFNKSAEKLQTDIRTIVKAGEETEKRMALQQIELRQQVVMAQLIDKKLEDIQTKMDQVRKVKLEQAMKQYAKLSMQIDTILAHNILSYQPERSEEEKQLLEKLRQDRKKVQGKSGYIARTNKLLKEVEKLKEKLPQKKTEQPILYTNTLSSTQLTSLKHDLDDQKHRMNDMTKRINSLMEKLTVV